jgi:hypothetical protein
LKIQGLIELDAMAGLVMICAQMVALACAAGRPQGVEEI